MLADIIDSPYIQRLGTFHLCHAWNLVIIAHMTCGTVIESEAIGLESKPESVAISGKDRLNTVYGQLQSLRIKMVKMERRRFCIQMYNAVIAGKNP